MCSSSKALSSSRRAAQSEADVTRVPLMKVSTSGSCAVGTHGGAAAASATAQRQTSDSITRSGGGLATILLQLTAISSGKLRGILRENEAKGRRILLKLQ
jgi:hypothetical protein